LALDAYQRNRIGTLRPIMQALEAADHLASAIRAAAARIGFSKGRLENIFYAWRKVGDEALLKKSKLKREKKPASESLDITPEEQNKLRQLHIKCGSFQYAVEALADLPGTRAELRELINRHRARRNYPKALRRAARVTPEDNDQARGPKRFNLRVTTQLRTNTWIDAAGQEHELVGGDIFECDDMSLNQPFWYEWPYGGDKLSDMFGVRLGRQMLASIDTATGKWLGFDLIGRVRDAYRAEDVVRFLGRIGHFHGLPRLGFRLEHGVWASRSVRGVKGTCTDEGEVATLGSIRDAVAIHYVHSPKAKGIIEGSFDMLQTILSLSGIQIGRTRGEYEKTTALMLKCADGRMHPKLAGFPYIGEIAERVNDAMRISDARNKMGRLLQGIPQEKFSAAVAAAPLHAIAEEHKHLFLPHKAVKPITGGFVHCTVPHYGDKKPFSFAVPPELVRLGRGYKLLVYFDPADPHAGARVFDAKTDGSLDFHSVLGQSYGVFPYVPPAPNLDFSRTKKNGHTKGYTAAARTSFRAVGMVRGTGASIDQVADGHGNSARIARGLDIAAQENLPAGDTRAAEALQARRTFAEGDAQHHARKRADRSAAEFGAVLVRPTGERMSDPDTIEEWADPADPERGAVIAESW
jgi:hypothetical protein